MSMVEKVARAICSVDGLDWDAQADAMTSGSGSSEEQQGYFDRARAAIEAMRTESDKCPRCGANRIDTALLGKAGEGHVCGACWAEDRHAESDGTP